MQETMPQHGADFEPTSRPDLKAADWATLNEMLQELPQGIPILPPEDAGTFSQYRHPPPHIYAKDEAWQKCATSLETHDSALCKGYREEIDTLLVFAGLFSAVVTAFSIESYQWLQDDPNDVMVILLSQIARSVAPEGEAPAQPQTAPGMPHGASIRINCYWFLSLSISLSAALVAILCKQWIREFESYAGLSPKDFVGFRQLKFESLQKWNVGDIISTLPVLLQLSLAMFFLGILELLFQLHPAVAAVVCFPTLLAVLFYVATTLLPATQFARCRWNSQWWQQLAQCPYHSPQAFLVFRAYQRYEPAFIRVCEAAWRIRSMIQHTLRALAQRLQSRRDFQVPAPARYTPPPIHAPIYAWNALNAYIQSHGDHKWAASRTGPALRFRGLAWLGANLGHSGVREWIWNCIWEDATGIDSPYMTEWLRRGIIHVLGSTALMAPQDPNAMSPRALALLYLASTNVSSGFVVEMIIQNLPFLDPRTATHFVDHILVHARGDTETAIAVMRAVSRYTRLHISEDLGVMLRNVTHLAIACQDAASRTALRSSAARLIVNWLDGRPAPAWAALDSARWMLSDIIRSLCRDSEDYLRYPEQLQHTRYMGDMAALVRRCLEMSGQPITWPLPPSALHHISPDSPASFGGMEPVILEILRISVCGIDDCPSVMHTEADPDSSGGPGAKVPAPKDVTETLCS